MADILPLILASKSRARQEMLRNTGLEFKVIPAKIDEREIENNANYEPQDIAMHLARVKALSVAKEYPDSLVIGSDQVLIFENSLIHKAKTREEARLKLQSLRGKKHFLVSAVSIAKAGMILFDAIDSAELTMYDFNDNFLENYLDEASQDILSCVGSYALEGAGRKLFSEVKGDFNTILGMPIDKLLSYLKEYHKV